MRSIRISIIVDMLIGFFAGACSAQQLSADEILKDADQRIQKYRTRDITLQLADNDGTPLPEGTKVKIQQTRHEFLFGCGIFKHFSDNTPPLNTTHENYFTELFNYATIGFFWWWYEPEQGQCRHERTEHFIRWAKKNNIKLQGSPVAWNYQDPDWLPKDPQKALQLQFERVRDILSRYQDDIDSWILVNEATHVDREDRLKNAPILVKAVQQMGLTPYVKKVFRIARQADPDDEMVINDYRHDPAFENVVLKKLVDDEGKPLYDTIGLQSHQHRGAFPLEHVWEVCERFAKYGKPLHWSEVTFLSGKEGWFLTKDDPDFKWASTPEGEKRQAEQAVRFYKVLFSHPAVSAITWWQLSDKWAWQEAPAGLLHEDMTPKPAYHALHNLIKNEWWTKTEKSTDANGTITFRGFFGDYRIQVTEDDKTLQADLKLNKQAEKSMKIQLEIK